MSVFSTFAVYTLFFFSFAFCLLLSVGLNYFRTCHAIFCDHMLFFLSCDLDNFFASVFIRTWLKVNHSKLFRNAKNQNYFTISRLNKIRLNFFVSCMQEEDVVTDRFGDWSFHYDRISFLKFLFIASNTSDQKF